MTDSDKTRRIEAIAKTGSKRKRRESLPMTQGQDLTLRTVRREARRRLIEPKSLGRVHRQTCRITMRHSRMPLIELQLLLKIQCSRMRSTSHKKPPRVKKNNKNTSWLIPRREKRDSLPPPKHSSPTTGPDGIGALRMVSEERAQPGNCLFIL